VFVTGRGGPGFHSPDPALTRGRGGYVLGNPRPAPVRGPPALIPWTGPRLLAPIFNGDASGVLVGQGPERGQGQGIPKNTPRPRLLSGAGRGTGPGARIFRGPVRPLRNSVEEHVKDVTNAYSKLQNTTYYPNTRKSVFFDTKLDILGHMIDDDGIHPAPEKVRTIMDWTKPKSQKELQRVNGMVNYISQFIPHIATITAPLTELSGNAEWLWTDLQEAAFEAVKRAADKHKVLRPIDYNKPDMI